MAIHCVFGQLHCAADDFDRRIGNRYGVPFWC
jgi:hypothetical protein